MNTIQRAYIVTVFMFTLSFMMIVGTAAAKDAQPGGLVSARDIAFIRTGHAGQHTPLTNNGVVGLFRIREVAALTVPYAPAPAPAVPYERAVTGLMIAGSDLWFIAAPDGTAGPMGPAWAAAFKDIGFGQ